MAIIREQRSCNPLCVRVGMCPPESIVVKRSSDQRISLTSHYRS